MKIAVIGSGVSGLGAAWLLKDTHDVTVFEKNAYVGGHSNTVDAAGSEGQTIPVDTGFIVYNERTYPNLIGLLDTLGVERIKTDMSFAVSADQGRLEYGGSDLWTLFAQKRNIVSPRFHRMVRDILRFYKSAPHLLEDPECTDLTLGQLLRREGYSQAFVDDHLLPMAAAIWSCPVSTMGAFPAASFIRFFDNHGLLQVNNRPQWWTVKGGSRNYVNRIRADLTREIQTGNGAKAVIRDGSGVLVVDGADTTHRFDQVIFACHGDEAHALLANQTDSEQEILSSFTYQKNHAILHSDLQQMPKRKKVWSSWNYLTERRSGVEESQVSVTYWMNQLQSLDQSVPLFVTLNPIQEIDPASIHREFIYDHPVFDQPAMTAQTQLNRIQGNGGVWFCGSYCGYGFHEDGLGSAVAVARSLGIEAPWGHKPVHAMRAVLGEDLTAPVSTPVQPAPLGEAA